MPPALGDGVRLPPPPPLGAGPAGATLVLARPRPFADVEDDEGALLLCALATRCGLGAGVAPCICAGKSKPAGQANLVGRGGSLDRNGRIRG